MNKYLKILIAMAVTTLGFLLAPNSLHTGTYNGQLMFDGKEIDFEFEVNHLDGELLTEIYEEDGIQINFRKQATYALEIGNKIEYFVNFSEEVETLDSIINNGDYSQNLPPVDYSDGWYKFSIYMPYMSKVVTALLFLVAYLWLTEMIPLAAASLLVPVVAVLFNVTDATTIFQPFFHPIIVLFFAGFLLAEAMKKTGVDKLIALVVLKYSSLKPARLMLTLMVLTAFLSMWMSNTASVAIIIPIVLAIVKRIQEHTTIKNFNKALVLGVAYAASIGGIGSAIGTPANILAFTFLNNFTEANLSFVDWFAYGLPIVVIMLPITWFYLILSFGVRGKTLKTELDEKLVRKGFVLEKTTKEQKLVLIVFVSVIVLWLTGKIHHIPTSIVALIGAVTLFFTGILEEKHIKEINWNALLTFGGGLAIGNLLVITGVSDWIALQLTGLSTLPWFIVVFLVGALTLVIGAFISNTACAAMMVPVAIPLAQILGLDPRLLVAVIAIGSSIDFALIVGTPPTMMAYSTGLFKAPEIFKRGIFLDIAGLLSLSFIVVWVWKLLGVVTI